MQTTCDGKHGFRTGINRRGILKLGAAGLGGLSLANLLQCRAESGTGVRPRAVIMVCLAGGPSHIDTYDLKPDAPSEYRGEFKPIASNVPGFDLCEHLPLQAQIADKLALVRSVQFVEPMQHELEEVYTGFANRSSGPRSVQSSAIADRGVIRFPLTSAWNMPPG